MLIPQPHFSESHGSAFESANECKLKLPVATRSTLLWILTYSVPASLRVCTVLLLSAIGFPFRAQGFEILQTEPAACENATWAIVGKITHRISFTRSYDGHVVRDGIRGGRIASVVTVRTERVAHGQPPAEFDVPLDGGIVGQVRSVPEDSMPPFVGNRFALLLHAWDVSTPNPNIPADNSSSRRPTYTPGAPHADQSTAWMAPIFSVLGEAGLTLRPAGKLVGISSWIQLDAHAELPNNPELEALWAEHCGPVLPNTGRPTQKYLALLPLRFLDWCEHY